MNDVSAGAGVFDLRDVLSVASHLVEGVLKVVALSAELAFVPGIGAGGRLTAFGQPERRGVPVGRYG